MRALHPDYPIIRPSVSGVNHLLVQGSVPAAPRVGSAAGVEYNLREVVLEGIRRVAASGANRVWVGSGQRFYETIGFKKTLAARRWTKALQSSVGLPTQPKD